MRKWGQSCALALALMAFAPAASGAPQIQAVLSEVAAALAAGNGGQAERLADAALAGADLAPVDRSRLLIDRGTARDSIGRHEEALVDLTQAIEAHILPPVDQARALFARGVVLDGLDRTRDAIGDYNAALTLQPRFAPALNNRANAYRRQNQMAEAKRDYLASLSAGNLQPEYSYYGLGQIAEASGNVQGARGFYARAMAANPGYGLASERLVALGGRADQSDTGVIHLRPPKGVKIAAAEERPVILKQPGIAPAPPRMVPARYDGKLAEPGLRPALDATVQGPQVQLGAWRTEDEARQAWNLAQKRAGGLLNGLHPHIVTADLPGRGRYYRLRAGPAAGDAARFCVALQAQGLDCFPVRD